MCNCQNLSDDEKAIVRHLLEGKSNQQISDKVCRSLGTVENKLTLIYASLDVKGRKELQEKKRKYKKK